MPGKFRAGCQMTSFRRAGTGPPRPSVSIFLQRWLHHEQLFVDTATGQKEEKTAEANDEVRVFRCTRLVHNIHPTYKQNRLRGGLSFRVVEKSASVFHEESTEGSEIVHPVDRLQVKDGSRPREPVTRKNSAIVRRHTARLCGRCLCLEDRLPYFCAVRLPMALSHALLPLIPQSSICAWAYSLASSAPNIFEVQPINYVDLHGKNLLN